MTARRWSLVSVTVVALVAIVVALFPGRAEALTVSGRFTDDNGHPLENGIEAIANAGITFGCNPPANNRYCPDDTMTRAQAAAFVARALDLPDTDDDFFNDDNGHALEGAINRLAEAEITLGCNPPANDQVLPQPRADSCRVRRISRPRLRPARNEQRPVRRRRRPCARGRHQPGSRAGMDLRLQSPDQRQVLPQRSFDQGPERRVRPSGTRATHTRDRRPAVGVEPFGVLPGRWPLHPQPRRRAPGPRTASTKGCSRCSPIDQVRRRPSPRATPISVSPWTGTRCRCRRAPSGPAARSAERAWVSTMTFSRGTHTLVAEWRWAGTLSCRRPQPGSPHPAERPDRIGRQMRHHASVPSAASRRTGLAALSIILGLVMVPALPGEPSSDTSTRWNSFSEAVKLRRSLCQDALCLQVRRTVVRQSPCSAPSAPTSGERSDRSEPTSCRGWCPAAGAEW